MGVSAIMGKVIDTAEWAKEVDEGVNNGALVQSLGVASLRLARYGADRLGAIANSSADMHSLGRRLANAGAAVLDLYATVAHELQRADVR